MVEAPPVVPVLRAGLGLVPWCQRGGPDRRCGPSGAGAGGGNPGGHELAGLASGSPVRPTDDRLRPYPGRRRLTKRGGAPQARAARGASPGPPGRSQQSRPPAPSARGVEMGCVAVDHELARRGYIVSSLGCVGDRPCRTSDWGLILQTRPRPRGDDAGVDHARPRAVCSATGCRWGPGKVPLAQVPLPADDPVENQGADGGGGLAGAVTPGD